MDVFGAGDTRSARRPPAPDTDPGGSRIAISAHAEQRVRERCGWPRRAVRRAVERAWSRGLAVPCETGHLRRRFAGFDFVFARQQAGGVVLVTVLNDRILDEDRLGQQHAAAQAEYLRNRKMAIRARMRRRREQLLRGGLGLSIRAG